MEKILNENRYCSFSTSSIIANQKILLKFVNRRDILGVFGGCCENSDKM